MKTEFGTAAAIVALLCGAAAASARQTPERRTPTGLVEWQPRAGLEQACRDGDAEACTRVGEILAFGRELPTILDDPNPAAAVPLFERACSAGNGRGCARLAALHEHGQGAPKSPATAAALYGKACDAGYVGGCAGLARMHERGEGVVRDASRAKTLYDRAVALEIAACDRRDGEACRRLSAIYRQGAFGLQKDPARARMFQSRACDIDRAACRSWDAPGNVGGMESYTKCLAGDASACFDVGNSYLAYYEWRPGDFVRAAYFFLKGCDAGDPQLCVTVGEMYAEGKGFARDPVKALELYHRACDKNDKTSGCFEAARLLERGRGIPRDATRAAALYERSCDANGFGCPELAGLLQRGEGVAKDPARAFALYERSCANRDPDACYQLGLAYRDGIGVARDPAAARKRFLETCRSGFSGSFVGCAEACEAGDGGACQKLAAALDTADGIQPDPIRAAELYQRAALLYDTACASGDQQACEAVLRLYRDVRPIVITNGALALRVFGRVCEAGAGPACHHAAAILDRGQGVRMDRARAAALYERGCDRGDIDSCERLAEMYGKGDGVPRDLLRSRWFQEQAAQWRRGR